MSDRQFDLTPSFPNDAQGRVNPAALYAMRRRRALNLLFLTVTPWSAGLTVTTGQYVSIGQTLWQATSTGTSGATKPINSGDSDGGVTWVKQAIMSIWQYRYATSAVPTP
jgi:hypothetical protein